MGSLEVQFQILLAVGAAMFLGALVGLERELADKPAGLRTHILVAAAASLLVSLGDVLVRHFDLGLSREILRSDPIRIIEAVITGVSFLGAGTIIRGQGEDRVAGLTTAASILLVAAIGVCVALSQYALAVGVTLLALLVLRGLGVCEKWLGRRTQARRASP